MTHYISFIISWWSSIIWIYLPSNKHKPLPCLPLPHDVTVEGERPLLQGQLQTLSVPAWPGPEQWVAVHQLPPLGVLSLKEALNTGGKLNVYGWMNRSMWTIIQVKLIITHSLHFPISNLTIPQKQIWSVSSVQLLL